MLPRPVRRWAAALRSRAVWLLLASMTVFPPALALTTFARPAGYGAGPSAEALAVGDFTGDGRPDLATIVDGPGYGQTTLHVWINNGDGTFLHGPGYPLGPFPRSIAVGDFNRDGRLDLVVANTGTENPGQTIGVFLGHGDGTFSGPTSYRVETNPTSVGVGDFNGDGFPDIVTTNVADLTLSRSTVTVLLGNGDGSFQPALRTATDPLGVPPGSLVLGDLNRDGRLDLVASVNDGFDVLFGRGDGTFDPPHAYPVSASAPALAQGDMNHDGWPDLVVVPAVNDDRPVFFNRGDGSFLIPPSGPTLNPGTVSIALGDFSGDGSLDLVTAASLETWMSLQEGTGDGGLLPPIYHDTGFALPGLVAADFDGDGRLDLAAMRGYASDASLTSLAPAEVLVLRNTGEARFRDRVELDGGPRPGPLVLGDLNADGHLDLAVLNVAGPLSAAGAVSVLLGQRDGRFGLRTAYPVDDSPVALALGDVNGDGPMDLVTVNLGRADPAQGWIHHPTVTALLGRGDGTFPVRVDHPIPTSPGDLAVGDLNGDGVADVVVTHPGDDSVRVLMSGQDGPFQSEAVYALGVIPGAPLLGDFNGDGRVDVAVSSYDFMAGQTTVTVLLGAGDGTFPRRVATTVGGDFDLQGRIDLNGDGVPDLVAANLASSSVLDMMVKTLRGRGDGTFVPIPPAPPSENTHYATTTAIADFDGDGADDLAILSRQSSRLGLLFGQGDGTFRGLVEDAVVRIAPNVQAGDVDGDGKPDLVLSQPDPTADPLAVERVVVLLNRSPAYLRVRTDRALGQAGDRVALTVSSTVPLASSPRLEVGPACVDPTAIALSQAGPGTFTGSYVLPAGGSDCTVTFTASGRTAGGDAAEGQRALILDRVPPRTEAHLYGARFPNGWYDGLVTLDLAAQDAGAGVESIRYGIDDPACRTDSPDACRIYSTQVEIGDGGAHAIVYFSRDRAGHVEEGHVLVFKIDRAPVAGAITVTVPEATPTRIALPATDPDGDPLTFTTVSGPKWGTLGPIEDGHVAYTSVTPFHGADAFTFRASDGPLQSGVGTVHVQVTPINHAPVAADSDLTGFQDRPAEFTIHATDPDGDRLIYRIVTPPAHGVLAGIEPELTYMPDPGYVGDDRLTFVARDASLESAPATVVIHVTAPLLAWDRVVAAPGEIVTLALRSTPAGTDLAGLDLTVDLTGTAGALPLVPTFTLGAGTADGALAWDPRQPWHAAFVRAAGITGAAELLRLTVAIPPTVPPGTVYTFGTRAAMATDPVGAQTEVTDRVAAGRILIPPLPGDLNGDGAVTTADVSLMFRFVLDVNRPDERQRLAGDVRPRPGTGGRPYGDGEIHLNDMIWVLRRAVGLEIAP